MSRLCRMRAGVGALTLAAGVVLAPAAGWSQPAAEEWTAPRTAWGDPDIGGVWNSFGDRAYLFASGPGPQGGTNWDLSPDLRVVERFTRVAPGILDYEFTVHDPNVWTTPWTGSSPWARGDQPLYEYACHEGNYGMTNILAGSRAAEAGGQSR